MNLALVVSSLLDKFCTMLTLIDLDIFQLASDEVLEYCMELSLQDAVARIGGQCLYENFMDSVKEFDVWSRGACFALMIAAEMDSKFMSMIQLLWSLQQAEKEDQAMRRPKDKENTNKGRDDAKKIQHDGDQ